MITVETVRSSLRDEESITLESEVSEKEGGPCPRWLDCACPAGTGSTFPTYQFAIESNVVTSMDGRAV